MAKLDDGSTLYGSRWQRYRKIYLLANPLCVFCAEYDHVVTATVVDHIKPHRSNAALFWDESNWQSLCKCCHDGAKQREEKRGYSAAVSDDGWPLDPCHPANSARVKD